MQSILEEDRHSYEYNWLVQAKSVYLKQHEKNPVNWLEWSTDAFEKARREGKPVFLSVGFLNSKYCKAMAKESFEDEKIAKLLNERFVSIKVDRDERPEIAQKYAQMCHEANAKEQEPLSVFLTPDQVPFYAGTYIPKEKTEGNRGFMDLIIELYNHYKNDPEGASVDRL